MRGQVVRLQKVVNLVSEECCVCGVVFGMTTHYQGEARKTHSEFHCPNGHPQHYIDESEAEKNSRLLKEERARHQRTIARENEHRIAREQAERKLKRVAAGVCPECKRTFQNLAKHMSCKHQTPPKFTKKPRYKYLPESG